MYILMPAIAIPRRFGELNRIEARAGFARSQPARHLVALEIHLLDLVIIAVCENAEPLCRTIQRMLESSRRAFAVDITERE